MKGDNEVQKALLLGQSLRRNLGRRHGQGIPGVEPRIEELSEQRREFPKRE
jgi:hypothetical protein